MPSPKITPKPARTSKIDSETFERLLRTTLRTELSALQSRRQTTDAYTEKLHETDTKVTEFIQHAIEETTRAYRLSVDFFIGSYVAAFLILLSGLILIFLRSGDGNLKGNNVLTLAIIFVVGSVVWIISLQSRNPVKNSRFLINNLAKLNVIFAGYIRQIHQVDAVFEELVGSDKEISAEFAEQLLNNLQDAMAEAMNSITTLSGESDD